MHRFELLKHFFMLPEWIYSLQRERIQGLPLREIEKSSCRSRRLIGSPYSVHYALMLCLYVHFLTNKLESSIIFQPTQGWPLLSCCIVLLSAPTQCAVSRSTCHCQQAARQAVQSWAPGTSTPPWGCWDPPQSSRARSVSTCLWVEWRYTVS